VRADDGNRGDEPERGTTMNDTGPLGDLVFTIDIRAKRQQVWDEITKTGRIQLAMHNTILESGLTPGAKLRYYSPNRRRVFVVGEVLDVSPPRRFSHTFKFTMRDEAPSVVTWELEETPSGCRVTLIHGGWTNQVKTHKGVVSGWREILALLKSELETGDIPLKTKVVYGVLNRLLFLLPRSTKVEEVAKVGW
jgi:uncharacterized protein YndB with AHSA1/START domain